MKKNKFMEKHSTLFFYKYTMNLKQHYYHHNHDRCHHYGKQNDISIVTLLMYNVIHWATAVKDTLWNHLDYVCFAITALLVSKTARSG